MKTKNKTEAESPRLELRGTSWCDRSFNPWVCSEELVKLFRLDSDVNLIVIVAKTKADRSTYKTALGFRFILKPIEAYLFGSLREWLKKQIAAGRPHIGVRIIK